MRRCRHVIAALALLATAGCELFQPVTAAQAVRLMEDRSSADARREGIADLSSQFDYARVPPYTTRYQQIARTDEDFTVKAMAIRALNISRDRSATPIFVAALDDDHVAIRLEGAKALANLPDPAAVPGLLRLARGVRESELDGHPTRSPEDRDVRIAATDALRRYPTLDVERTLVSFLNENEFGIAWQSRQSLMALTGQDLRYDEGAWLQYLVRVGS